MIKSKAAPVLRSAHRVLVCGLLAGAASLLATSRGFAQGSTQPGQPGSNSGTGGGSSSAAGPAAVGAAQTQLYNASGSNGAQVTQDTYKGSVISGKNTGTVLDLTLEDSIQRGLRQNLGIILEDSSVKSSNGQRLEQLQALLPTVTASSSYTVEQINLAAYGLKFPGLNPIVGPFQVVDFRAYLTQNLLNLNALQTYIAAKHSFAASRLTAQDARDMVVLTVGNAYLLCIADQARIDAVNAELATSKVTLDQAIAGHDAGTNPRLDVLRAQVDYQNEQQSLISTTNTLAKDKLALARVIGLPLDQQFHLTDAAPFKPLDNLDPQMSFEQALKTRKDLQASVETVHAGEAQRKAAIDDQLPTISASGDFGDIGTTPGQSHGTYTATGHHLRPHPAASQDPRRALRRRRAA